tara:strand:+ start:230 stop:556 length:327 start_codon:yes stop_codon:yes gene_type:complete
MNEVKIPNFLNYYSFKWCLEYLLNWSIESIEKDHKQISEYFETLAGEEEGTEEENQKLANHIFELHWRMAGAQFALIAIRDNQVPQMIEKLKVEIKKVEENETAISLV